MAAIDTAPSRVATSALQGIPFSSLIGGPLGAAIEAQAQSAKTTIDFIQNVGLTGPPEDRKAIQVEFIYFADGREVKLMVPLLTILPIPFLAVQTVDINFKASINASSSSYQEDTSSTETTASGSASVKFGWGPVSGSASFSAGYSSKKDSKATQESRYSVEYTMDVAVHASQDDMPAGLAKVLGILESSIAPTSTKPTIQVVPSSILVADGERNFTTDVTLIVFDQKGMRVANQEVKLDCDTVTGVTFKVGGNDLTPGTPTPVGETDDDGTVEFVLNLAIPGEVARAKPKLKFSAEIAADGASPVEAKKSIPLIIPAFPAGPSPQPNP